MLAPRMGPTFVNGPTTAELDSLSRPSLYSSTISHLAMLV
jgi:hypothetical protein